MRRLSKAFSFVVLTFMMCFGLLAEQANAIMQHVYVDDTVYTLSNFCNSSFLISDIVYDNRDIFLSDRDVLHGFTLYYINDEKQNILQCIPSYVKSLNPYNHIVYYNTSTLNVKEIYLLNKDHMLVNYTFFPKTHHFSYISYGFIMRTYRNYVPDNLFNYRKILINKTFYTYPFSYRDCIRGCGFTKLTDMVALYDVRRKFFISFMLCNASFPLKAHYFYRGSSQKIYEIRVSFYNRYLDLNSSEFASFIFFYAKNKTDLVYKKLHLKEKYACKGLVSYKTKKDFSFSYKQPNFESITLANALRMPYNLTFYLPKNPFSYNLDVYCSKGYNPYAYFKALNDKAIYTLDCSINSSQDLTSYSIEDYIEEYPFVYKIVVINISSPFIYYSAFYSKHAVPLIASNNLKSDIIKIIDKMREKNVLTNPLATSYGIHVILLGNETYIPKPPISDIEYAYLNDDEFLDLAVGRVLYPSLSQSRTKIKHALLLSEYEQKNPWAFINRFNGMFTALMFNVLMIRHNIWVDRLTENRMDLDDYIEDVKENYDVVEEVITGILSMHAVSFSSVFSAMVAIFNLVNGIAELIHETDLTAIKFIDTSTYFQVPELTPNVFNYTQYYDFVGYFGKINSTHFLLPDGYDDVSYSHVKLKGITYIDGDYSCNLMRNLISHNINAYGFCLETKKSSRLAQERGAELLKLLLNGNTLGYSLIHSANLFVFSNSLTTKMSLNKEVHGRVLYGDPSLVLSLPSHISKKEYLAYYFQRKKRYEFDILSFDETLIFNLTPLLYIEKDPFFVASYDLIAKPLKIYIAPCNSTSRLQRHVNNKYTLYFAVNLSQCNVSQIFVNITYPFNKPYLLNIYDLHHIEIYSPNYQNITLYVVNTTILHNFTLNLLPGIHNYTINGNYKGIINIVLGEKSISYVISSHDLSVYGVYLTELYPNPYGKEENTEFIELYKETNVPATYILQINNKNYTLFLNESGIWIIVKSYFLNNSHLVVIKTRYLLPNKRTKIAIYYNNSLLSYFYYNKTKENCSFIVNETRHYLSKPNPLLLKYEPCDNNIPIKIVMLNNIITPYKKEKLFKVYLRDKSSARLKDNLSIVLRLFNKTFYYNLLVGKSKTFYFNYRHYNFGVTPLNIIIFYRNNSYRYNTTLYVTPLNCSLNTEIGVPFVSDSGNWVKISYLLKADYLPVHLYSYIADEFNKKIKDIFDKDLIITNSKKLEKHWRAPSLTENTPFYLVTRIDYCNRSYLDKKLFVVKSKKLGKQNHAASSLSRSTSTYYLTTKSSKKTKQTLILSIMNVSQHNDKLYALILINSSFPFKGELYSFVRINNTLASYYCENKSIKKGWKANKQNIFVFNQSLINLTHCLKTYGRGYLKVKLIVNQTTHEITFPLLIHNFSHKSKYLRAFDSVKVNATCTYNDKYFIVNLYAYPFANLTLNYDAGNITIFVKHRKTLKLISKNVRVYYNNSLITNCTTLSLIPQTSIISKMSMLILKLINTLIQIL